eukprot:CAMPEP_0118719264 /NCGR_PEP_ID=MMETSP0800-20121206/29357_1 /TAXON_ID=210618 ORGANISM="Striatella unipunctata, Strain CCMP2910" /NCGR_SAMPLE_ID=MMETSP0800 /ASSEMBLY_ACC=CAM_ASM_000638 /LENGTH=150 /DNA_ID=CAMNT_0006626571 /DNA_START=77 /DNA_END=529 /DNA_ORIENTATION=+
MYYRLMGAKIGNNVRISLEAEIAEFDLITIGDGSSIEYGTVRAFGLDNGCMILGPVGVGQNASVGMKSVVPPYTKVGDGAHLGPVSSSYEVGANLDGVHRKFNRKSFPEPQFWYQLFVCRSISFFVDTCSHIPDGIDGCVLDDYTAWTSG